MRLETFSLSDREATAECTIVPLPGDGGGIEANVRRWLEQLQVPQLSSREMEEFLGRQEKKRTRSGLPVVIVDFTTLGRRQPQPEKSMLAAIIQDGAQTLFVKLSGARPLLEKNRDVFLAFCRSLSRGA